jgi:hypothetical protein
MLYWKIRIRVSNADVVTWDMRRRSGRDSSRPVRSSDVRNADDLFNMQ